MRVWGISLVHALQEHVCKRVQHTCMHSCMNACRFHAGVLLRLLLPLLLTMEDSYIVIPARPAGTDGWGEQQLARLVTRDSMIGVAPALSPEQLAS